MILPQLIVNGLIAGAIYALIASGFSLIYATNRFVHFAHGSVMAIGAHVLYVLFTLLGLNFYFSALLTIILTGLIGGGIYWILYYPMQKKKTSAAILLIASLALSFLLENLLMLIFGSRVKNLGFLTVKRGIEFLGIIITPLQILIILSSLILFAGLWLFIKYSRFGRFVRAVSDNPELSRITGINARKVQSWSFIIASAIAGFAGILIGLEQNVEPLMGGTLITIKAFTGSVIGGVVSLPGAVLGSYILGLSENIGILYLPSGYKDAIAFGLLLVFLLFRPQGIFGINKGVRK